MISSGLGQSIQCCPADISKQERCGSDLQIRTNWRVILRLVVSNLMSRQRPVMSSIPQLLALGLIPFNSFVVTWTYYHGSECILSKFADSTTPHGVVDTLKGRDAIQRVLDRLERWVHANIMKFIKIKHNALQLG